MIDPRSWFTTATGHPAPRPWQERLLADATCRNRVIRVPTGQGKTLGVLLAWLYHRCLRNDERWPRRLVWVLPMRVLTEQTVSEAACVLTEAGLRERVGVHCLMGGISAEAWHLYPEREQILIGTQDMLLSRALNRGYAAPRARWPMEFGLLSQDSLWVYDEIQLMDVALATSAQLQAYRDDDADKQLRPVFSWWMSATLQNEWLRSVDTDHHHADWCSGRIEVASAERQTGPCAVNKSLQLGKADPKDAKAFAETVLAAHQANSISLVVCNTVDRACECYDALVKMGRDPKADIELVHSRFRPTDRAGWRERFLKRSACSPGTDRIIVATQVVEAGVDISAQTLITELAPWPSLVQRFGRCARYEGNGCVHVIDRGHDEKNAKPYEAATLAAALAALTKLGDVGIASLETFEESLDDTARTTLYPYEPAHLLLRRDYDELFDTTPDLTGADLDIARFIRTGEERDIQVCWHSWPLSKETTAPPEDFLPGRESLCSVPVYKAEDWLKKQRDILRPHRYDYVEARWLPIRSNDRLRPGMLLVVAAAGGGYDPKRGWTGAKPGKKDRPVSLVEAPPPAPDERADTGQDREDLSQQCEQHIAAHGFEVARAAEKLAEHCAPSHRNLFHLAGRLHDWGKAHLAFQNSITNNDPARMLAKAPNERWHTGRQLYPMGAGQPRRPGFRHELASVLAIFELLARHDQMHPALLGDLREIIACGAVQAEDVSPMEPCPLAEELAALSAAEIDLLCHLVASHHGKLRASWHACPQDQDYPLAADDDVGLPLRGIRLGDMLPALHLAGPDGSEVDTPALSLHLAPAALGLNGRYGRSWRERSLALQTQYGPAALAYLEAILRAADIRISKGERDLLGDHA